MRMRVIVLMFSLVLLRPPLASAMNWEGHDDWLEGEDYARRLKSHLPSPPAHPLPSCHERDQDSIENQYEQRPVPGQNCHSDGGADRLNWED